MSAMRAISSCVCLAVALWSVQPMALAQPMGLPSMGAASSVELSPAIERTLGEAIMAQGYHDPTYVADLDVSQYLTGMGQRLAAHAPRPLSQEITVFAVRDPSINAFAMPGGFIGVNSGLLTTSESESELAGVLAHEIAHVMQRHIARGIEQQSKGTGIMVASLVGAVLAALAGQGDLAMGVATFGQAAAIDQQLGFSRSAEQEADRAGLQMMRQAGFEPRGMLDMFKRLMNASRLNEGAGRGYASTHPLSVQRLSDMENRLGSLPLRQGASSPEYWFVRARLAVLQAQDNTDRQRLGHTLRSQAVDAPGVRRAAALYGLALLARQEDQWGEVQDYLREAQALQAAPQLDVLAIDVAIHQGDDARARTLADQAWKRWPDHQGVAQARARALLQGGHVKEATAFLQALTRQWPRIAQFHKMLATALERQGEDGAAHEAMATYFELQGALPTAVEHLQQARGRGTDFYAQSRIDVRIRELRDRLEAQRELLEPFRRR